MKRKLPKVQPGKTKATVSISIEPKLVPAAKARAVSQRRTFSAYVVTLIEKDLSLDVVAGKRDRQAA